MTRFCINCKYSWRDDGDPICRKRLKTDQISPVTGKDVTRQLYGGFYCEDQRTSMGECGPGGKYWEEKETPLYDLINSWWKDHRRD